MVFHSYVDLTRRNLVSGDMELRSAEPLQWQVDALMALLSILSRSHPRLGAADEDHPERGEPSAVCAVPGGESHGIKKKIEESL